MPLYLVKLVCNTLTNFRYAELDACLDFFGVPPRQAYDRYVRTWAWAWACACSVNGWRA